jgi:hypothetical protein
LGQIGLEHFELKPDSARFAPQQEFGVGKGQAVGVGFEVVAVVGMGLQLGPGVGQATLSESLRQKFGGVQGFSLWVS